MARAMLDGLAAGREGERERRGGSYAGNFEAKPKFPKRRFPSATSAAWGGGERERERESERGRTDSAWGRLRLATRCTPLSYFKG